MTKNGEIYINGRPIGCITKQPKITLENPAPIGQDTHYEITAEKIEASFAGEMMSKELRAKIEEFERNLPEKLIKQFYESHQEWFGDMPYPVAYEYICKFFDFSKFKVKDNTLVFYPEWRSPEEVLCMDVGTPLLDKWVMEQERERGMK